MADNKNQAQLMDDYGKNVIEVPALPSEPASDTPYYLVFDGEKWVWQTEGSPE